MFELRPLHGDIRGLHLRRFQLRLRLRHIGLRRGAAFEAIDRELQGFLEGLDRVIEEPLLCVGAAQLEIIERELCLNAESGGFQVAGGCLRFFAGGSHAAADPSPQVDLVGYVAGQKKVAGRGPVCRRYKGSVRRIAQGTRAEPGRNRGEQSRAGKTD